jgi:uncharacterized membrane protein
VQRHADLILRAGEETVQEAADRQDVRAAYDALVTPSRFVRVRQGEV